MEKEIENSLYAQIVDVLPILCVDGIVKKDGKYLLVKRNNKPLKGEYFVPGGRVLKGETVYEAFRRKMRQELGVLITHAVPVAVYEDVYEDSEWGCPAHTVSVVFETTVGDEVVLDSQSSEYIFSDVLPERFVKKLTCTKS